MKDSDNYRTPKWLFDELNAEFNFEIDLCANLENTKCGRYMRDYLKDDWVTTRGTNIVDMVENRVRPEKWPQDFKCAFMNPPYSTPYPFIKKAWEDSKYCKIVCLVKADSSTKWWAIFWNYKDTMMPCASHKSINPYCPQCGMVMAGPKPGCEIRFFPKRIKFELPGKHLTSANFPSALLVFDRRNT